MHLCKSTSAMRVVFYQSKLPEVLEPYFERPESCGGRDSSIHRHDIRGALGLLSRGCRDLAACAFTSSLSRVAHGLRTFKIFSPANFYELCAMARD